MPARLPKYITGALDAGYQIEPVTTLLSRCAQSIIVERPVFTAWVQKDFASDLVSTKMTF